jgi:c-di-AMP phosphodiesterase-like protein
MGGYMKKKSGKLFNKPSVSQILTIVLPAILALFLLQYLTIYTENNPLLSLSLVALIYILLIIPIHYAVDLRTQKKIEGADILQKYNSDMNAVLYSNISAPIVACDLHGVIRWGNQAYRTLAQAHGANSPKRFSEVADIGIDSVMSTLEGGKVCVLTVDGRNYRLDGTIVGEGDNCVYVTIWHDVTELENCKQLLAENDALVAYIYLDNLDELSQLEKEHFGSATAIAERTLHNWATEVNGILINYERDKFILFYMAKYLNQFLDNKFEILDKMREIRIGENYLPITVSIGTSNVGETFQEKNENAFSALKFALAKGGDQAIVRTDRHNYVFGGMTKTAQKRSSVKSQTIARTLTSYICRSSNVLIMGHRMPDFDSIGSCIGVARLCMYSHIPCKVIVDQENRNFRKCFSLLDSLPEYQDMFITAAQAQELVGVETLLILCDVNNPTQFEAPDVARNIGNFVCIDHHRMIEEFRTPPLISYIEPSASSACELVSEVLEQVNENLLRPQEANLMYAGIILDTKHFAVNTGVRTFESARFLRSLCDPGETQKLFRSRLDEITRESRFILRDQPYLGRILFALNDEPDNEDFDITIGAKLADKLLTVEGIEASFVIIRWEDSFRISGRSSSSINVEKILSKLGGGGHFNAAAAQKKTTGETSIDSILEELKRSIDLYLSEDQEHDSND